MDEYLNKRILLKALEDDFNRSWKSNLADVEDYVDGARDEYDDVLRIICSMQTTDIQSVKLGRWLNQYEFCKKNGYTASGIGLYYWCSNCGKAEQKKSDYCPNCGAQMDLDGEIQSNKANIE